MGEWVEDDLSQHEAERYEAQDRDGDMMGQKQVDAVMVIGVDVNFALEPAHWFDGCPFSAVPLWLQSMIQNKGVIPHNRGSTDYASWDVVTMHGVKTAGPGDWIVLRNGELSVCPGESRRQSSKLPAYDRINMTKRIGDDQLELMRRLWDEGDMSRDNLKRTAMPGMRIAYLNRVGLTEWIRPKLKPWGSAIGIRLTDAGRTFLVNKETSLTTDEI